MKKIISTVQWKRYHLWHWKFCTESGTFDIFKAWISSSTFFFHDGAIKVLIKYILYSGLLKIRTPKNPDFCVFAKQGLSKKSGLLCSGLTGLILKIRTYDLADMELVKILGAEAHFSYFLTLINGFFKRSV